MPAATEDLGSPPTTINPYHVLDLSKDATEDQIKTAYRKAALRNHPDKVPESEKEAAHTAFQEIAFAYAVLSDSRRRARYDATGRTVEVLSLDDEDGEFNWADFFRAQFAEIITPDVIERFKKEYQGSEEEKLAVIEAYVLGEGDMEAVFEGVMLSDPIVDEERFRGIIDAEIEAKRVEAYDAYAKESKKKRAKRVANAKKEAKEAEEMARELGVADKLYGNGTKKGKKGEPDMDGLAAIIQQRQQERAGNFLADLEAKYAPKKRGTKRAADEFDEDAKPKRQRGKKQATVEESDDAMEDPEEEEVKIAKRPKAKPRKRLAKKLPKLDEVAEEDENEVTENKAEKTVKRKSKGTTDADLEAEAEKSAPTPRRSKRTRR
ncbi:DnaJ-domain-containing protein [Trichodelitschia bisporula]|uniref:DnaJ-domain-containing protein n=1 Tax=Trichodelitschia bisporula TaxID=703511 RepID=A0A6G1HYP9_9PEZI|nr:DnaJ-domain-containing protein [Trichodelitschia bisporula]